MEIDISRSTTVRAMTMAGTTSVVDIRLTVVSIMRGSTGGMAEMSTTVMGGSTTIAVVASVMGVTAVVEVKMRLSDSTVAGVGATKAIAGTRVTKLNTVEGVLLLLTVNGSLLDCTTETMIMLLRSAEAVSGRSRDVRAEAVLGRSTNVEAALVRSADAQTRSAVTSVVRTSGLGERAVRSLGSVERSVATVRVRSTITMRSPFSSGGSSNNSSESESLEHLTIKYIESLFRGFF